MLLHKSVHDGGLKTREVGDVPIYWVPAVKVSSQQVAVKEKEEGGDGEDMQSQIEELKWVEERYEQEVLGYMEQLHRYNETKDVAQELIGRVASVQGQTVKAMYPKYGLEETD
jgi:hypothetical protein